MDIRLAVILDRPTNNVNKIANSLYLGDYESCNAGDISSRLYIEDSNGDIIELEDTVSDKLETLKSKIIEIKENMTIDSYKPKLLFMVRKGENDSINYNNVTKKKLQSKLNEIVNNGTAQPFLKHVSKIGVEYKLFPFLNEKLVFGIIDSDNPSILTDILIKFTNDMLKEMNIILVNLYNLIIKYNKDFSKCNKMFAENIYNLDSLTARALGMMVKLYNLESLYPGLIDSIGLPTKCYTISSLLNAGHSDRYANISISPKNVADDIKQPYSNVLIVCLDGSSNIISTCSFKYEKKTKTYSEYYGNSNFFCQVRALNDNKMDLVVRSGYMYKIYTDMDANVNASGPFYRKERLAFGYIKELNIPNLLGMEFVTNGQRYKLDMTTDKWNGRILKTINVETGHVESEIRSEDTSISGYTLVVTKGSIKGFFRTLDHRTVSGLQPIITDTKGRKWYMTRTEPYPIYDQIRFSCNAWSTKGNAGTNRIEFYDFSNRRVHVITGNPAFGTWATNVTYSIPKLSEIKFLRFTRYIDTRSHGGAHLNVDIMSAKTGWKNIIKDYWYRTGDGWETVDIHVNIRIPQ